MIKVMTFVEIKETNQVIRHKINMKKLKIVEKKYNNKNTINKRFETCVKCE